MHTYGGFNSVSNSLRMNVYINNTPFSALVDTGSTHSILKFNKQLEPFLVTSEVDCLKVANSQKIDVLGKCSKNIKIGNISEPFEFLVCKNISIPVVIGMDFLKKHKCVIDLTENEPKLCSLIKDNKINETQSLGTKPYCQNIENNDISEVHTQNKNNSENVIADLPQININQDVSQKNLESRNHTTFENSDEKDKIKGQNITQNSVKGNHTFDVQNFSNTKIERDSLPVGNQAYGEKSKISDQKEGQKMSAGNQANRHGEIHESKNIIDPLDQILNNGSEIKNEMVDQTQITNKKEESKLENDIQIFCKKDVTIEPGQIIFIQAYTMCKPDHSKIILVEPSKLAKRINKRLFLVHAIHFLDNDLSIQVLNVTDKRINIPKDKIIAAAREVDIVDLENLQKDLGRQTEASLNQISDSGDETWIRDLKLEDTDLNDIEKQKLKNLIAKYHSIFSKHKYDIGQIKDYEAEIVVTDTIPRSQPYRPIPYYKREELQNILDELLRAKIIQESHSQYCSPIVLVKKKDGSLRLTVDYREINKIVQNVQPTLPHIEESIAKLYKNKYFTSIDLSSAYWQVPLKPESMQYTAFAGNQKLWEFRVLPMGLSISPSLYNRVILHVLQDVAFKSSIVYLDDISILGESFDEHLENLEAVFKKLQEHGMKIQFSKCNFMKRSLKFLGYKISKEGVATDESKIECVKTWPTPCNTKALMRFLGFVNFYRKFIPDYATKSKPLYELLKKDAKYEWTRVHEQSFQTLRKCLIEAPILKFANMDRNSKNFVLQTDASKYQISAVLLQEGNDGILHPIAYASRVLKAAENNYCATKLELTAIIFGLQKYRYYLLGRPFEIQCDHKALTFVKSMKKPSPMLARYIEVLSEYDFTISHLKGKNNYLADALSRNVCKIEGCPCSGQETKVGELNKMVSIVLPQIPLDEFLDKQLADDNLAWIIEIIQDEIQLEANEIDELSKEKKGLLKIRDKLEIKQDILVYRDLDQFKQEVFLPVVPKSLIPDILMKFHSHPTSGGHFGIAKTIAKIKQKYFWLSLRQDCIHFCKACTVCLKVKPSYTQHRAPLQPIISQEFNERVQLDITGPFEQSVKGNRYCLTVICCFTKFIKCIPIPSTTAEIIAQALIDHWISVHSTFKILQSDNAQNFRSNLMKQLCILLGVHKKFSSPYTPSTNGQIENLNKSLKQYLIKYISQLPDRDTWCDHVPLFSFAYNTTPHSSTGIEPFVLVYGRKPNFVDDMYISEALAHTEDIHEYVSNLQQNILVATEFAQNNLAKAKTAQKTTYDKKATQSRLRENQLVLLHKDYMPVGQTSKLEPRYTGPYIISEVLSDLTYKIIDPKNSLKPPRIVHINKLRAIPDTRFDIQRTPQEKYIQQRLKD